LDDPLDFAGMTSEPSAPTSEPDDLFGMDLIENSTIASDIASNSASDEDLFGLDLADASVAVEAEDLCELVLSNELAIEPEADPFGLDLADEPAAVDVEDLFKLGSDLAIEPEADSLGLDLADEPAAVDVEDLLELGSDSAISSDDSLGLAIVDEPALSADSFSEDPFADPFASIAEQPIALDGFDDPAGDSPFDLLESVEQPVLEAELEAIDLELDLPAETPISLPPLSNEDLSNFADLSADSADVQELFVEELELAEPETEASFSDALESEASLSEALEMEPSTNGDLDDLSASIFGEGLEEAGLFEVADEASQAVEENLFDLNLEASEQESELPDEAAAEPVETANFELDDIWATSAGSEQAGVEEAIAEVAQPEIAEEIPAEFSLDDSLEVASEPDSIELETSSELDFDSLEQNAPSDFGAVETGSELDFGELEASAELEFDAVGNSGALDFDGLDLLSHAVSDAEPLAQDAALDEMGLDNLQLETEPDLEVGDSILALDGDASDWFSDEAEAVSTEEAAGVDISDIFAVDDLEVADLAGINLADSEMEIPSQAEIAESSLDLELATLEQFDPFEAEEFIALSPTHEEEPSDPQAVEQAVEQAMEPEFGTMSGFMQGQESTSGFEFGGEGFEAVAIATPEPVAPEVVPELVELEPIAIETEAIAENFDELDLFMGTDSAEPVSSSFELDFGEGFEPEAVEPSAASEDASLNLLENSAQPDNADPFGDSDDFSDLEAMLGQEPAAAPAPAQDNFDDLDALLADDIPQTTIVPAQDNPAPPKANDEFGDLEDLLKDADQALGGGSTNRKAASAPNRRSNRRGVMTDQTMRVSVKHLDNLNNLVGEMVVNRNSLEQAQERLRQFLDNLLYQVQQLSDVGQRMRDLYERSLLESSLLSTRRSYHLKPASTSGFDNSNSNDDSSHATGESFDALEMDRFTGFHTLSQEMIELIVRVRESASDIDFVVEESDQVTRNFRQITTQLQEGLTRARMVPFAQTADRLPRGVRDNALKYGKQAELLVEGRDTLIDKMIVEQLYDPMTHLVNNAVAHGVETAEERIAAGKPAAGKIILRTFHQGNQTIISVSDDGAGIDQERVKSKAIAKGLITAAEAKEMSRMDTYDLLFHHGFSTADQIDDLKGRGVGLDVVRSNLNEIRGVISIDSTLGKGTTFTIRLPLTLSISKALCCISNRARIAFPMDGVEDMLDIPKERVQTDAQGRPCIYWRDALLPFQPLTDLLKHGRMLGRGSVYGGNQEDDIISVVVLRSTGVNLALQVDQVLGEQEIVIKQLEGPVPKPIGIAGATVLGDGRIMPIADVLELIDLSEGRIRRDAGSSLWEIEEQLPPEAFTAKTEPTVLIVDDSITVRELLSMTFNKVGYRVEQARDGQEAWEKLRSGLPCDLVFCDIEMPRMDGLELLSRIQKDSSLNHLPIAMLTSRGADRHRQMAVQLGAKGYFTKPYLEEALLDAAQRMLKGEVLVMTKASVS
jgi:chemotaxis protein histidine kinase CheA/CheY-like chemotaxis protein